jgi:hypothetical protein
MLDKVLEKKWVITFPVSVLLAYLLLGAGGAMTLGYATKCVRSQTETGPEYDTSVCDYRVSRDGNNQDPNLLVGPAESIWWGITGGWW